MAPFTTVRSRRQFLSSAASGLGAMALASLVQGAEPLAPKKPHHRARAKSVIWLFMEGGPSHIDLFDPKPELDKLSGQPTPPSFNLPVTSATGSHRMPLVGTRRKWKQHGQSGLWVSDWYPRVAAHADKLAVVRSCWADGLNHVGSVRQMNTGSILAGRPSLGAWTTYGLGASNRNMPSFVVLTDEKVVRGGPTNWSSGFLPATFQGTHFQKEGPPILDLKPPADVSDERQRARLDFLRQLNEQQAARWPSEDEMDARMETYELAYRMQAAAPGAVDLGSESEATRRLYGMDQKETARFGTNCLLARRLVEHGVRFVEVYCGSGSGWDAHTGLEENHTKYCRMSDQPIAGLLTDLESRGLLEETLVVWGGEFGRTPFTDSNSSGPGAQYGRDHNPWGFTMWMAGGGTRGGQTIGSTDAIGFRAVEKPYHVHDVHATVLNLLGLDHMQLTHLHNGRSERPTINGGKVIAEALA